MERIKHFFMQLVAACNKHIRIFIAGKIVL